MVCGAVTVAAVEWSHMQPHRARFGCACNTEKRTVAAAAAEECVFVCTTVIVFYVRQRACSNEAIQSYMHKCARVRARLKL